MLIPSDRDGRIFFVIPWMGCSLIGTTDTDYSQSPDKVGVTNEDIDYLIDNTRRVFPDRDFSCEKIISSFAGLRPLVRRRGSPSKVTRSHVIFGTDSGLTFVAGGKYTTYRKIAEDALMKACGIRGKKGFSVYGGGTVDAADAAKAARQYNLDEATVRRLAGKYGTRYMDVARLIEGDRSLADKICDCSDTIKAQVAYSVRKESALTADDIISRRLSLQFVPCASRRCRSYIEEFVKRLQDVL